MLRIDLPAVEQGPVETKGSVAPDDPLFVGLDLALGEAVAVHGQLVAAGPGRYYWRGHLRTRVRGVCRRCLAPVDVPVGAPIDRLFTEDAFTDDPSAWVIEVSAAELDLTETIREELILSVPAYVLCREDCRGLCPGCGEDLNVGVCVCRPSVDPRWGPLQALRGTPPDDPR